MFLHRFLTVIAILFVVQLLVFGFGSLSENAFKRVVQAVTIAILLGIACLIPWR